MPIEKKAQLIKTIVARIKLSSVANPKVGFVTMLYAVTST
jgi:hypothetical protein